MRQTSMVDRLGMGLLALGAAGLLWMAWPTTPSPRIEPAVFVPPCGAVPLFEAEPTTRRDHPWRHEAETQPIANRGDVYTEVMRGPFASLGDACPTCVLDAETMRGAPPFDELTVLYIGDKSQSPDLGSQHRLELAVRVGAAWYFRDLGMVGPICGGLGSPTWIEATAGAPELVDLTPTPGAELVVRVIESFAQSASERRYEQQIICGVGPSGTPSCARFELGFESKSIADSAHAALAISCDGIATMTGWSPSALVHDRYRVAFP